MYLKPLIIIIIFWIIDLLLNEKISNFLLGKIIVWCFRNPLFLFYCSKRLRQILRKGQKIQKLGLLKKSPFQHNLRRLKNVTNFYVFSNKKEMRGTAQYKSNKTQSLMILRMCCYNSFYDLSLNLNWKFCFCWHQNEITMWILQFAIKALLSLTVIDIINILVFMMYFWYSETGLCRFFCTEKKKIIWI